ncbi:glycoside hydrolase domain-containing protein [Sunxiuqinia sp. sy24]|uniref:glycoside hydrolase domain-containing protein n=1 Tax=Sunxiuqinia sp. sy24 TaxID=3461495 RepID=UPI004045F49B
MKNLSLIALFFVLILGCSAPGKVEAPKTYAEAPDPSADTLTDWSVVKPGLHATIGSIDNRYNKSLIPDLEPKTAWKGFAWRNEIISAQLVLWNNEPAGIVECQFSDFKSADEKTLPAEIAQARFVRYVLTDEFGPGCGYRKPEDFIALTRADALDPLPAFEMEAQSTRPVWLTFDVPADATPGTYTSTLQVMLDGKKHSKFTFNLEVGDRILPEASEWKFHLDLWQNPYAVARVHNVELWSAEHWDLLKPLMKMLADAGQKVITATLNNRPWGGQTEDAFGSMIAWNKQADGSWTYDYTIFDQWVQFMLDLGIDKQISCYSMVPWGNELYYFDVASGEEVKIVAKAGTKEFEEMWTPFLKDFLIHLEQKRWKDIACMSMDERSPAEMTATMKLLAEQAPELGVGFADNHHNYMKFPDQLTDLSIAFGAEIEPKIRKYRKDQGYISTWYVCCSDVFPNVFTFSEPAEAAFIGWYTMAADFDGFLRWAYNSWVKAPLIDSRFRTWPAGDTFIVYPDARSSIRFERLREGIQDAEKIRLLRDEFQNNSSAESQDKLRQLNELLSRCNVTARPADFNELMQDAKETLESLSK